MTNSLKYLALAVLLASVSPFSAGAQEDWQKRIYVKFDAGAAWTSTTEVKEMFGSVTPGTEVEFDLGPRLGVDFGYNVTDWFAGELEVGIMANSISKITGASEADATFLNVPVMLNARFQLPNRSIFTPYAGIGAGGASSVLDINSIEYGNTRFWGSASDAVFAWQAFAGFRVALNQNMGLGAEYRYFRSEGPSFETDYGWYWNIQSDRIAFGDIETHVVSLRFDVQF